MPMLCFEMRGVATKLSSRIRAYQGPSPFSIRKVAMDHAHTVNFSQNELLKMDGHQRSVDARTASKAGGSNPPLATLDHFDRTAN